MISAFNINKIMPKYISKCAAANFLGLLTL
jgi:hypothetical protein